ncbi:MAG: cell division protein FtsZ [Bacteroidales bacterium]|nr:cell division protein FtsZ [Bacteroidales bacterium]
MDEFSYNEPNGNSGENLEFNDINQDAIIKVIGVGGGGGNAVNYMFKQNIPNINYVVCNTDKQAIDDSPVPTKLVLGFEITGGRGAGNVPEKGRQCAEASEADIRNLFKDQTEMVFITAGMGGGTGTGAAPVVARIAKECGMLTIGIVTVPFMFEGEMKILKALEGADEMQKNVDALLVINNENLIDLYPDLTFLNAFSKADDTLANAARSISEIISEKLYINVDFQDVKTVLKDSGTAIIATAEGDGEHRISNAIHNALHSPLLKRHDINTSKRLLIKFNCSSAPENTIRAEEINEITQFTAKLPPGIDVKWGIGIDDSLGSKVKVTVLSSGFVMTIREGAKKDDVIKFGGTEEVNPQTGVPTADEQKEKIIEMYGAEKMADRIKSTNKVKYAVLKPWQFDDHEVIAMIEKTPAYNRDPQFNDRINASEDKHLFSQSNPPHDSDTGNDGFGDGSKQNNTITFDFSDND